MSALAGPQSSTEQLALCETLAPEIAGLTRAFYDPTEPHPYLRGPSAGGTLEREVTTRNFENLTQINVSGLSVAGIFTPELLARRGLPAEVSPDGVLWSVITDHVMYPARMRGTTSPKSNGTSEHTFNYWDGRAWHTSRKAVPEQANGQQPEWVTSTLMPEELVAMQAVAKQTRGLHQIADVYRGDVEQLEHDMSLVEVDPETRKWLNVAFASALTMGREVEATGAGLRGFMSYYGTGYQYITQLLERVPLGKSDDEDSVRHITSVGAALARMYQGSALIQRDSMRKRAWRARKAGRPLPLPASW